MAETPYPAEFFRTITLPIGILIEGQDCRNCTIGPETRKSVARAYGALDDFVDTDLARQAFLYDAYEETRKHWDPVKNGKMHDKPALTLDELRRGRRHLEIWRDLSAAARVTKIGPIPETEVVQVAFEMTMDDVNAIAAAAMEVDEVVANFRAENRAADQGTTGMVISGDAFV